MESGRVRVVGGADPSALLKQSEQSDCAAKIAAPLPHNRPAYLVCAVLEGDVDAAERLFGHYRKKLYRIAEARLGSGRRNVEVSDVVDTTLRRAVRSLSTLKPACDEAVDGWFVQILNNAILDDHRRRHAQRRGDGRAPVSLQDSQGDGAVADSLAHPGSEGGTQKLEKDELAAKVWQVLSEDERALFSERVFKGSSWDKVARKIKSPSAEAARKRFENLRDGVRRRLGQEFGEDCLLSS